MVVGGATRYIDHQGNPILKPTYAPTEISHDEICVWTALPGSCSNELVRRDAFERVGGFDPTLIRCQDRELYMRLAAVGRILVAPEITLLKRVHDGVRPGVDFQRVFEERSRVNERIADPRVRKKADAMLYFHLVRLARRERRSGDALRYLLRSALAWPGRIAPRVVRWRYVAEWLVPGPLRALARGILGRRASRGGAHASG